MKCMYCNNDIESDSKFCKFCGAKIDSFNVINNDEMALINKSGLILENILEAKKACMKYIGTFPRGKAAHDMLLTNSIIDALITHTVISQGDFPEIESQDRYEVNALRCNTLYSRFEILQNGIVISLRVEDTESRINLIKALADFQDESDAKLIEAFNEAEAEKDSLLINGETRSKVEKKTREDVYRDAEIYYELFKDGNYEDALKGFIYLKQLNPFDSYFRNLLGSCYSYLGKSMNALREFLYGYYLDPGSLMLADNLLRELTTLNLNGSAYAVYQHYKEYGERSVDDINESVARINLFGNFAELCLKGLVSVAANLNDSHYSENAVDVIDEFIYQERPWLQPLSDDETTHESILENKKIFISYRRSDSGEMALKIKSKLKVLYPSLRVFLDETSMIGGDKFTEQIRDEIDNSDYFILLISPYWNSENGVERINTSSDILRREILRAETKNIPILPVLINGASTPKKSNFPNELKFVTQLHSIRMSDATFNEDFGGLISDMTTKLSYVEIRERQFEQEMEEIQNLFDTDRDAWKKKMDEIFIRDKDGLQTYIESTSLNGEGIPSVNIDIYGIWKSDVLFVSGGSAAIEFAIEDRNGSQFKGNLTRYGKNGEFIIETKLSGNWSRIIDKEKDLFLGFQLTYIGENNTEESISIPIHNTIGNAFIGSDIEGSRFSTVKIEGRVNGF